MDIKKVSSYIIVVLLIVGLFGFNMPKTKADVTTSLSLSCSNSDGSLYMEGINYAGVRSDITGIGSSTSNYLEIGQAFNSPIYGVKRSFVYFDTSTIPATATINNVTLSLYVYSDASTTDFNVTIQSGQPTYPHNPLQGSDFYYARYSGNGGNRSTGDGLSEGSYWNITLNADGLDFINVGGETKFCLRASRDINGDTPAGEERVIFYSANAGSNYTPKLYISYTVLGDDSFTYVIHGPYWDNGTLYNGTVYVNFFAGGSLYNTYTLTSTGLAEDNETITIGYEGDFFRWNITESGNETRSYYLLGENFEELWIRIPNTAESAYYYYTFTITDFYGMTNPYIQFSKNIGGTNYIIETRSLATVGIVTVYLEQWETYTITFLCDQGSYSQGWMAESMFTVSLQVLAGSFPIDDAGIGIAAWCNRTADTTVTVYYTDSEEATVWLYMEISHRSGSIDILDYTSNTTGYIQTLTWTDAEADRDYDIYLQAYTGEVYYEFNLVASSISSEGNPFSGLFNALGTWPDGFDADQLPAAIIIILVLAIFSVYSHTIGIVLSLIIAVILGILGFFTITASSVVFAGFVAVMAHLGESKKMEREV